MSDIVKKTEQLPADFGANLMKGIEQTRSTLSTGGGGKPFMRLSRAGEYIFGLQNIDVQSGSHWAVNLAGLEHGWVCWGDGELLGQIMCSVQQALPVRPTAIEGYPFEGQWGMTLACIKGDDAGLEVVYKNNSLGFRKAFDQLLADVRSRYVIDQQYYWPVIELETSNYHHKKYGKIFEPIFKIVGWADAEGQLQTAKPRAIPPIKPEPAPEATAEPAGEPATAPRVGQRRRPVAR